MYLLIDNNDGVKQIYFKKPKDLYNFVINNYQELEKQSYIKQRNNTKRYNRNAYDQEKLKKRSWLSYKSGIYYNKDKRRYMKCYFSKERKFAKRQNNKIIRRTEDIKSGSEYRKYYDFWWNIF